MYILLILPMKLSVIDFTLVFIIVSIFIIFFFLFCSKKVAFVNLRGFRMGKVILKARKICKSYYNGENNLNVLNDLSLEVKKMKL